MIKIINKILQQEKYIIMLKTMTLEDSITNDIWHYDKENPICCIICIINSAHRFINNMAALNWNQETKNRLNEKIQSNVNDIGSLARQVVRGSKSNEVVC